jgi:hypothetical protein
MVLLYKAPTAAKHPETVNSRKSSGIAIGIGILHIIHIQCQKPETAQIEIKVSNGLDYNRASFRASERINNDRNRRRNRCETVSQIDGETVARLSAKPSERTVPVL